MQIFAYCMKSVANIVWQATGAFPVTCPPFDYRTFPVQLFEQFEFIWLGLHGTQYDKRYLLGDTQRVPGMPIPIRPRALCSDEVAGLDLEGVLVFAPTCYLPETLFVPAFKTAGATVVGGQGKNYGNTKQLVGADLLGASLINVLKVSATVRDMDKALKRAKTALSPETRRADADAMEFQVL